MRQLISANEATPVQRQITQPCSDCPFSRRALAGWLGSLSPHEWLAAAHGEALVDCHAHVFPQGGAPQCAGIAIYRRNVGKRSRNPACLRLSADRERVFAWPVEFLTHHSPGKEDPMPAAKKTAVKKTRSTATKAKKKRSIATAV